MNKEPLSIVQQEYAGIESEYRRKVAVTTARPLLERALFGAWFAVDAFLLIFFAATVLWYGAQGMFSDEKGVASVGYNLSTLQKNTQASAPDALLFDDITILASGSGTSYDLLLEVENPNSRHGAWITGKFVFDAGETEIFSSFVNPETTKTVFALSAAETRPRNPRFELLEATWVMIDPHEVANVQEWLADRDDFAVADVVYAKDIALETQTIARTTFTLTNRTPYSYWEPSFLVRLTKGSTLIAVTSMTVPQFVSGESRTIDLRWFGDLPQTASVSVQPDIAFFDEEVYMNPTSP